jgi:hypothetical protein
MDMPTLFSSTYRMGEAPLVEKRPSTRPFSPQIIRPAANGHISPGSIENVGQGALVPVQMCPIVPVCATNRD